MCEVSVSDAKSVLPFVSLNGATGTGEGSSIDLGGVASDFMAVFRRNDTATYTDLHVKLQGSLDGVDWYSLNLEHDSNGSNHGMGSSLFVVRSNDYIDPTELQSLTPKYMARHVRAYVEAISGSGTPTITATIAVGRVI